MRTAADFNSLYASVDPWRIAGARVRDNSLRRRLAGLVSGQNVLELGCGEGHLTEHIFSAAKSVTGIDISPVAVERAIARNVPNGRFEAADFLNISFRGYDVIAAIECLYYLSGQEQGAFFQKVADEHPGRLLVLSGPIIDQNKYFTHKRLKRIFNAFGFSLISSHNLTVYWHPLPARIVANIVKLPLGYLALDWLPEALIYQRLYVARAPS